MELYFSAFALPAVPGPAKWLPRWLHRLGPRGSFTHWIAVARRWRRRAHERHLLAVLGPRGWSDLGLTRAEIEREVAKPFWRE